MSCRLVNVTVEIRRQGETRISDRQTLKPGDAEVVATLDGVLEETTAEERMALAGLDEVPAMRFIAYWHWFLQVRDRLRVLDVKYRWRNRYGHLSGAEYVVLSVSNSCRGMVGFLGAQQAEAH